MPEWPAHGTSLSALQRRAVLEADPITGEVTGSEAVLRALVNKRLAAAHGRRGARHLTGFGRQVRAQLQAARQPVTEPGRASSFTASTGEEVGTAELAPGRSAAAEAAWEALLDVRRMTGAGSAPERTPAAWEHSRTVPAIALLLEAAGVPSAVVDSAGKRLRAGYRVTAAAEHGSVQVRWLSLPGTPAAVAESERQLRVCAELLGRWGWQALLYQASGGVRFLAVAPQVH